MATRKSKKHSNEVDNFEKMLEVDNAGLLCNDITAPKVDTSETKRIALMTFPHNTFTAEQQNRLEAEFSKDGVHLIVCSYSVMTGVLPAITLQVIN